MIERVKLLFLYFEKAFKNLETAVDEAKTELEIDGTIKRFELCYELAWKLIKEFLANLGIICKNPRDCFKQAFINDLIEDENIWLKMIEDRNELVHLYEFANSRKIFENINNLYVQSYKQILKRIKQEYPNE